METRDNYKINNNYLFSKLEELYEELYPCVNHNKYFNDNKFNNNLSDIAKNFLKNNNFFTNCQEMIFNIVDNLYVSFDEVSKNTINIIFSNINDNLLIPNIHFLKFIGNCLSFITKKNRCNFFIMRFLKHPNYKSFIKDSDAILKKIIKFNNEDELIYIKLYDFQIKNITSNLKYLNFENILKSKLMELNPSKSFLRNDLSIGQRVSRKNLKFRRKFKSFGNKFSEYVSPTELRNYILDDPIIDWFKYFGELNGYIPDESINGDYDYFKFLLNRGNEFEEYVLKYLEDNHGEDIIKISKQNEYFNQENVKKTINAMDNKIPIIYQANLKSDTMNIFGIADLLIRSDKLFEYFNIHNKNVNEIEKRDDLYVVFDIKFSSLYENSNELLKNKGSMKCYKGQIYLYNKILNEIQGTDNKYGFVLGRRFVNFKSENLNGLKHLGVIDFKENDKKWCEKAEEGIEWIRWIRKEGYKYHPQNNPIHELLPNMNNRLDYPWHRMKKELSVQKSELTLLWSFGKKHREECLKQGITSFKDPNFSTDKVKLNSGRKRVLDEIISKNTGGSDLNNRFKRRRIMNISDNISDKKDEISFYVDFEFLNSCDLNFDYGSKTHLYMIGLGYVDPISEKWCYEVFIPRNLNDTDEKSNIRNWLFRMNQIKRKYNYEKYRLFHWSKAEPSLYNKLNDKFMFRCNFEWHDLLQEFRKIPFAQEGVFDFNLKNVAKMMKKKGLIKTEWNSSVIDGLGASIAIINGLKKYENIHEIKELKEIIYYNEVDCKVLCEMHQYLQKQLKL